MTNEYRFDQRPITREKLDPEKYPDERNTPLEIALEALPGRVILRFNDVVAWIALEPEQADQISEALAKVAEKARIMKSQ